MNLILSLHNIRSTYNVGSILRTAEGFGVKSVMFSGYTPRYDDKALLPHLREKLNHEIEKTALGAEKLLTLETSDDILTTLDDLKTRGYLLLGLENNLDDPRLLLLRHDNFSGIRSALHLFQKTLQNQSAASQSSPELNIVLCLGEEVSGLSSDLRAKMDFFLEIPMQGKKRIVQCLNRDRNRSFCIDRDFMLN